MFIQHSCIVSVCPWNPGAGNEQMGVLKDVESSGGILMHDSLTRSCVTFGDGGHSLQVLALVL